MPTPYLAPSLVRLRDEINQRWPDRDKTSDGWIGDTRHSAHVSQHNPDWAGCVHAIDVDKDGIDPDLLVRRAIKHPAAWYVIWNRRIWSETNNWVPEPYTGSNPHDKHVHISIHLTPQAERSTAPWLSRPSTSPKEGDYMSDADDFLKVLDDKRVQLKLAEILWTTRKFGPKTDRQDAEDLLQATTEKP